MFNTTILPKIAARICMAIFLLSMALPSKAQAPENEIASHFISQDILRNTSRKTLYALARSHRIDSIDFAGRYAGKKQSIEAWLQPYLQDEYKKVLRAYPNASKLSAGTAGYNKVQQAFVKAVERATLTALDDNKELESLVAPNYSDRILNFHSKIVVDEKGGIHVTEFITIYNGNGSFGPNFGHPNTGYLLDDIKRGIVRDFPTIYKTKKGFISKVPFELIGVFKNGKQEPFKTQSLDNGKRIMIGSEHVYLPQGIFTYRINYETGRQIIFHDDKDELYWNVNGNGWVFTADSISCEIIFPEAAVIKEWDCYTGVSGATEKDCHAVKIQPNIVWFSGSKNFDQYEGLTVAASIEKGVIQPPGQQEATLYFVRDNFAVFLMGLLVIGLFLYYFLAWRKHGKDPVKGTIIPQFEPPAGISPADAGFILTQKYQPRLFAAALVDCAVKNIFKIEVKKEGFLLKSNQYSFLKPDNELAPKNTHQLQNIYGFNPASFIGTKISRGSYDSFIAGKNKALEDKLRSRFEIRKGKKPGSGAFKLNSCYSGIGVFLLAVGLIIGLAFSLVYQSWEIGRILLLLWLMALVIHLVFARIMSAYTPEGRRVADHLEGFKMYLDTAEQKLFEYFTPPEKTLELFEKYLPYAIALGVENSWAGKFQTLIQNAIAGGYQPGYYHGSDFRSGDFSMAAMSQGLSSGLTSTISSASTPPSSSSSGGSSGGGSSGGGGGGGGGGGW